MAALWDSQSASHTVNWGCMEWTLPKKLAFRWLFTYVVLFCLQAPQLWPWSKLIPWVGGLLGVDAQFRMNGSGDTTYSGRGRDGHC
jgi:hypothetical protein